MVETLSEIPAKLHVLPLVLPNGHEVCIVKEDVGRHEDGVAEQSCVDGCLRPCSIMGELDLAIFGFRGFEPKLGRFVLELGHSLLAYRRKTGEDPSQFRV